MPPANPNTSPAISTITLAALASYAFMARHHHLAIATKKPPKFLREIWNGWTILGSPASVERSTGISNPCPAILCFFFLIKVVGKNIVLRARFTVGVQLLAVFFCLTPVCIADGLTATKKEVTGAGTT